MNDAVMDAGPQADAFDPFAGGAIERIVPTTEAQREVWLGDRLGPEASLAYNEAVRLQLDGPLDMRALAQALDQLVARHESLRASFSADGEQLLINEAAPLAVAQHDLSGLGGAEQAARLAAAGETTVLERFHLDQGPLFRASLYRLGPPRHQLLMSAHHAVCDGWSWAVLCKELGQLYAHALGDGPAPVAPARYADYADWEQQEAAGPQMQAHVDYWLSRFSGGSLPVLELPLDRPRPAVRTFASHRIDHVLPRELIDRLRKLGAAAGGSLFAALLGGFATLLHRLTGQDDLVVGIAAAGQLASDMPGLVGHCVNLLPLRLAVDSQQPFQALVRQSAGTLLDAFEHQNLTYGTLLKKLPVARDPSRLPLVSVLFNVDQDSATPPPFGGLHMEQRSIPRAFENFELFLNATPAPEGMRLEVQYNSDLFDAATVQRWLAMYECLLRSGVTDAQQTVGRLDMVPAAEMAALHALQPASTPLSSPALMHAGFLAQAAAQPERPALRFGSERWTYHQLDERSNQLAHALRARGIGRGQRVGLCLERGCDMLLALLAVLKSGAAYVPLDPAFPQSRLDYYAQDAQLGLLLTHAAAAAAPQAWCADAAQRVLRLDAPDAWQTQPATPLPPDAARDAQPEDPAYVIYTSGSTGKPKGVCVPHRAAANFIASMRKAPGIGPDDRLAAVTTLSFDIAVAELVLPLAAGAEVVVVPREVAMDGVRLRRLLEGESITVLQATPGMWRLLVDAEWHGAAAFRAWVGGESVPPSLALELLSRATQVWNLYGPTETTVWSSHWRMDRQTVTARGVSIGRPLDNTSIWVLDHLLQPCSVGMPGELCIGGAGVALGYLERPELTAERFVVVPIDGEPTLLYRTGDRGRWRNDGLLEHQGRFDFQVKVRGYRIELGEIEARCNEAPGVARSVVVAREDQPGDVRLVAYLALTSAAAFDAAALERHLRDTLPQYMLPQHVVTLDALPQLPNGKVDRKALPRPDTTAPNRSGSARVAPRNEHERVVLATMEQVLNLPELSIHDDFFTLGGHSLLAARLATLLGRAFDLTVPLRTLFESPTAERLAAAIDALQRAGATRREPIRMLLGRRSAPLTPMQERILFVEKMHPGRPVYNTPSGHRFEGPMDVHRFEAAFREMVRRQPALRTTFGEDPQTGQPAQQIAESLNFEFPVIDLSDLPPDQRETELMTRMQQVADQPIDIQRGPLFHVALYKLAPQDHAFVFVPHHLIWDGWSFDLYQAELSALYGAQVRGESPRLPALSATLGDFAEWYAQWMTQPEFDAQLAYWKARFAQTPAPRALGTDKPRQAGMSGEGAMHPIRIDRTLTDQLHALARRHDVTISMLALAIYALMMAGTIDSPSVVIAYPVRGREAPELEPVMGFFNNVLPLAFEIDRNQPLSAFVRQVKAELMAVMNHQQVPFERLVTEPEFTRLSQGAGLYQALFSFQDARERPSDFGGLRHRQLHLLQRGATDDLSLWLMEKASGLEGAVVYNADLYLPETGAALRDRYLELLAAVGAQPDPVVDTLLAAGDSPSAARLRHLAASARPAPASADAPASSDERTPAAAATQVQRLLQPEQARLAQVWASALNIDVNDIRPQDNFFDLGGDSLLAMRVLQQAEQAMGFRVEPRRYVFETLAQLAVNDSATPAAPAAAAAAAPTPQRTGLLGRLFGGRTRKD